MKDPRNWRHQVAALPLRVNKEGELNVLLVSSRETGRWVIPKGWPSKKLGDAKQAAREAREEAGVTGKIEREPVGHYRYRKVFPKTKRLVEVTVFVLWVGTQQKRWPERKQRTRIWTTLEDAGKLVREPGLKRLLAELHRLRRTHHGRLREPPVVNRR